MRAGVVNVRAWLVTMEDGTRYLVYAPNRRLAVLNLRLGGGVWRPIKTVGRLKRADGRRVPASSVEIYPEELDR